MTPIFDIMEAIAALDNGDQDIYLLEEYGITYMVYLGVTGQYVYEEIFRKVL